MKATAKNKIFPILVTIVIIGLAIFGGYFFKQYRDLKNKPVDTEQIAKDQADKNIAEIGKLYDLPKDERPSVATVSDKEKLKDQPFFEKAENGDITLIYSNAKLAILYRPSTNQIINVSSVTIQSNVKIKVIGTAEARKLAISALTAAQLTSTDGGDSKTPQTSTIIVDISGNNADQASKIADTLKGKVDKLPEGETKPTDTDILVIVGDTATF